MSKRMVTEKSGSSKAKASQPATKQPPAPSLAAEVLAQQAAVINPAQASPAALLSLQGAFGNQAVQRLLQTKLTVGAADDPYEREADRVASEVVSRSALPPQAPSTGPLAREADAGIGAQRTALSSPITPLAAHSTSAPGPAIELQRDGEPGAANDLRSSFEAGAAVEGKLASGAGGGSPLPGELRSFMEPRFGADFGQVRLHSGSESASLNRQLGAKAFTHVNHIYLGDGASPADRPLIAHELTHTIQQGAAKPNKVQRTPAKVTSLPNPIPDESTLHTETTVLGKTKTSKKTLYHDKTMKQGDTIDVSTTRNVVKFGDKPYYPVNGKLVQKHAPYVSADWITFTLSPKFDKTKAGKAKPEGPESKLNAAAESTGEMTGTAGEYMFQHAEWNEHLKAEKERQAEAAAEHTTGEHGATATQTTGEHGATATATTGEGGATSTVTTGEHGATATQTTGEHGATTTTEGATHKEEPKAAWEQDSYTYAQDSMYTTSDLVGFALGAKQIWDIYKDKEMSAWDKVLGVGEVGVDMSAKVADLGYRGKEIANKAMKYSVGDSKDAAGDAVHHADKVLAGFGGAAGVLQTVGAGIKIIKGTTELVSMLVSDDKHSKTEYAQAAGEILSNAAKAALGVVNTIKVIHYALGSGTMIMQAVPILGIIINGMRIIMDGYYLVISAINWNKLTALRKRHKKQLVQQKTLEALPSMEDMDKAPSDAGNKQKKDLTKQVTKDAEWYRRREAERDSAAKYKKTDKAKKANEDIEARSGSDKNFSREELAEYRLAKELRDVNRKRVVRQSLHISSAITQIVGDGLVLGGITSGAGAGLKAGAAGLEATLPLIRGAKQKTRDVAAKHQAKDKGFLKDVSSTFVDPTRSTTAKMEARKRYAIQILQMAANLEIKDGKLANPKAPNVKRLKLYLKGAGVSSVELTRHMAHPEEQVKVLVKALSTREFLE